MHQRQTKAAVINVISYLFYNLHCLVVQYDKEILTLSGIMVLFFQYMDNCHLCPQSRQNILHEVFLIFW